MTHAKDYISARTQHAKDSMPSIKEELEKLIANSRDRFINYGVITIIDGTALSDRLSQFFAQDNELGQELCNWLGEFGWTLIYKNEESQGRLGFQHRPRHKNFYLIPSAYLK